MSCSASYQNSINTSSSNSNSKMFKEELKSLACYSKKSFYCYQQKNEQQQQQQHEEVDVEVNAFVKRHNSDPSSVDNNIHDIYIIKNNDEQGKKEERQQRRQRQRKRQRQSNSKHIRIVFQRSTTTKMLLSFMLTCSAITLFVRLLLLSGTSQTTTTTTNGSSFFVDDENPYNVSFLIPNDDEMNPYYINVSMNETYQEFVKRIKKHSANNIEGRMLAACVTAYGINPSTSYDDETNTFFQPSEKYYKASGWLSSPTIIQHGPANIHAVLIGRTVDGIVIAFRGTLNSSRGWQSLIDYIESDILMYPYTIGGSKLYYDNTSSQSSIKVYAGAYFSLQQLWSWNPFYTYWKCLLLPWNGCRTSSRMIARPSSSSSNQKNNINKQKKKSSSSKTTSTTATYYKNYNQNIYLRNEILRQFKIATSIQQKADDADDAATANTNSTSSSFKNKPIKLYITGHSKGGTMAVLAAMKIYEQSSFKTPSLYQHYMTMNPKNRSSSTKTAKYPTINNVIMDGTAYNYTTSTFTNHKKNNTSFKNPLVTNKDIEEDEDPTITIPTSVYTFAAMKSGNYEFVKYMQSTNIPIYQYENYYDIIPLLFPPNIEDMQYIQSQLNKQLPANERPMIDHVLLNSTTTTGGSIKNMLPEKSKTISSKTNHKNNNNNNNKNNNQLLTLLQMMSYISTHHPRHVTSPAKNLYFSSTTSAEQNKTSSSSTFSNMFRGYNNNNNNNNNDDRIFRRRFHHGRNKNDNDSDSNEFYHVALPQNHFCMTYNKQNKTSYIQSCTYQLNQKRLYDIIQKLMIPNFVFEEEEKNERVDNTTSISSTANETGASSTTTKNVDTTTTTTISKAEQDILFSASSHHKPSCKGMGYMHGVCETVCTTSSKQKKKNKY